MALVNKFNFSVSVTFRSTTGIALWTRKLSNRIVPKERVHEGKGVAVRLQVIGTGVNGSPPAVCITAKTYHHLFNCGEDCIRFLEEHGLSIRQTNDVYLTRRTWKMTGGFTGLIMAMKECRSNKLAIAGPCDSDVLAKQIRAVARHDQLFLKCSDTTGDAAAINNGAFTVQPVTLFGDEPKSKVATSYICNFAAQEAKLIASKCIELGLDSYDQVEQLKSGESVTLSNGQVVTPTDVMTTADKAFSCVMLDLPDISYLPALSKLAETLKTSAVGEIVAAVHFSEREVLENKLYKDFIAQYFSDSTNQLYLCDERNRFSGLTSPHKLQYKLNQLQPQVFPLLNEAVDYSEASAGLTRMTLCQLRPRTTVGIDHTLEARLTPEEYLDEVKLTPKFNDIYGKVLNAYQHSVTSCPKYPRITFLGTTSSTATYTRNNSGILVQTAPESYMLLDCGEGTYGQMVRFFGLDETAEILRNLRIIYISHYHVDHSVGLNGILLARQQLWGAYRHRLTLLLPPSTKTLLEAYHEHFESVAADCHIIINGSLGKRAYIPPVDTGIASISTCFVRHCVHAYGITVEMLPLNSKPVKLTYSGDAEPDDRLVDLGQDSTILIHEATYDDSLASKAAENHHSTISQALHLGQRMRAEHVILTHFSQRYHRVPRLPGCGANGVAPKHLQNVILALDNMQLTLGDMPYYHLLYPALDEVFFVRKKSEKPSLRGISQV